MMGRIFRASAALIAIVVLALGGYALVHWAPDLAVSELEARWAPPPSTFVPIEGMQVHVRDEGPRNDQTPILLIHGTSSSLHTWDGWADQLAQSRRVVRFDLPGFGLTGPSLDNDYSIRRYVEFVMLLLDELEIGQATIAGNSLGGQIAWMTAVTHPDRVKRLILVDASGYAVAARSVPIGFRIASIPLLNQAMQSVLPKKFVRSSVENVFGNPEAVTDELVDRYYDLTRRAGNRAAMVQRFSQLSGGADAHRIPSIEQPTLILWGLRDNLIPVTAGERFAADIKDSRLIVFDALGHVPQEEDPTQSLAPVLEFLDDTEQQ